MSVYAQLYKYLIMYFSLKQFKPINKCQTDPALQEYKSEYVKDSFVINFSQFILYFMYHIYPVFRNLENPEIWTPFACKLPRYLI